MSSYTNPKFLAADVMRSEWVYIDVVDCLFDTSCFMLLQLLSCSSLYLQTIQFQFACTLCQVGILNELCINFCLLNSLGIFFFNETVVSYNNILPFMRGFPLKSYFLWLLSRCVSRRIRWWRRWRSKNRSFWDLSRTSRPTRTKSKTVTRKWRWGYHIIKT